jgi:hypothetical protein
MDRSQNATVTPKEEDPSLTRQQDSLGTHSETSPTCLDTSSGWKSAKSYGPIDPQLAVLSGHVGSLVTDWVSPYVRTTHLLVQSSGLHSYWGRDPPFSQVLR